MDKQREAFELWAKERGFQSDELDRCRICIVGPAYYNSNTEMAWQAWQAAIASQWQPIETAPRDGTNILAFTAEGQCEVYWDRFKWVQVPCYSTYDGCGSAVLMCDPTHWQQLPPEPSK